MTTHLQTLDRSATTEPRRKQRGVTLVEVLVTVVVISVGLLGVAALQTISYRDNYSAYLRGQASALADDIIDRMRANRGLAASYQVSLTGTLAGTSQAGRDVTEWKAQLVQLLPKSTASGASADANGAIAVTNLGTNRFLVQITVQWGERSADISDNRMSFVTATEI